MTSAIYTSISRNHLTAIQEEDLKFAWCGNLRHYRQIHCYLEGKPLCKECSLSLNVRLVKPEKPIKPKVKKHCPKYSVIAKMAERREKILSFLSAKKVLSTHQLYKCLYASGDKVGYQTFSMFLSKMVAEKSVVVSRKFVNAPNFYALPKNSSFLEEKTQRLTLEQLVLPVLTKTPRFVSDISRQLRTARQNVYAAIKRLEKKGLVSTDKVKVKGKKGEYLVCSIR